MENFFLSFQNQKHNKKRLTEDQVGILEKSFACCKKLVPEQKLQLSKQLGVPPRQIAIWYQNKRARWKTQSLEEDYGALQLKLENVLAEKKQLVREVERLKAELKEAKEMLLSVKREGGEGHSHTSLAEFSYDCAEVNMQVEQLYTFFMGSDKFV